jgi:hypothetical protein
MFGAPVPPVTCIWAANGGYACQSSVVPGPAPPPPQQQQQQQQQQQEPQLRQAPGVERFSQQQPRGGPSMLFQKNSTISKIASAASSKQ